MCLPIYNLCLYFIFSVWLSRFVDTQSLATSRDGQCALLGCGDNSLRLLDHASGALLAHYAGAQTGNARIGVAVLPGDAHVCAGSADGAIVLWDLVESTLVQRIEAHQRAVTAIACERDGNALVLMSASASGDIKLWRAKRSQ